MAYPVVDLYDSDLERWQSCEILGVGSSDGSRIIPLEVVVPATSGVSDLVSHAQYDITFDDMSFGSIFNIHPGAAIGAPYARSGAYGVRLTPHASTGISSLTSSGGSFPSGSPWASLSFWFRLVSFPSNSANYMNLFEIGNSVAAAPKSQSTVFFREGSLWADFNYDEAVRLGAISDNEWHRIEARVYFGGTTYIAKFRLDEGAVTTLTSGSNKTPSTASVLWVHYPDVAVDYTVDIDDILMSVGPSDPGWLIKP